MRVALVSAVVFAGLVLAGSAVSGERTASSAQVYFDQATGELVRRTVSVIDPLPELNRDFSWAPASGVPGTGLLTGSGTLTWRIAGSADFDRAAVHTVYAGAMAGGRPHGPGRLTTRDGLLLEGNFADGHLEGTGTRIDPNGDRYDGGFAAGLASGQGRLLYANGDLFEGRFVVEQQRVLKDKHLKLRLTIGQQRFDAIQFNFTTTPGREIHAAYRLAVNDYNGVQSVQLMIEHLMSPPDTPV